MGKRKWSNITKTKESNEIPLLRVEMYMRTRTRTCKDGSVVNEKAASVVVPDASSDQQTPRGNNHSHESNHQANSNASGDAV
ncbi:uncharacterized protein LOC120280192 isoform X2 [Dioscorea cayenensis subsp. rotundata]|uniref:Uncharacterized protein LOC120280192 isoform X2 n=1 Tax=Dioscorea cayennensis subsp. rotundata TaxID=55577 RepID=A0AB40CXV1_DIOCR|nr:uncharacterized protein LOC120280192 isoform X2 [Dioscorea cayenensis subsp. rotundata]XP_039142893.1 uncharacterized protein LOC120280192 isoform X2 [Dioscorea cayenensis subsp. rotundata]